MSGDHHGRTAGSATLLVRPMDGILGTHRLRGARRQVSLADARRDAVGQLPRGGTRCRIAFSARPVAASQVNRVYQTRSP